MRLRDMRIAQRTELQTRIDQILDAAADDDARDLTDVEDAELTQLRSDIDSLDARIEQLDADVERRNRQPQIDQRPPADRSDDRPVQVRAEPTTYGAGAQGLRAALVDAAVAAGIYHSPDPEHSRSRAVERLERHRVETIHPTSPPHIRSVAMSDLGGIVNPAYNPEMISRGVYDAGVTAQRCRRYPVWSSGDSITMPRVVRTADAGQQTEGEAHTTSWAGTNDVVTAGVTAQLFTVSAQASVTVQAIERGTMSVELLQDEMTSAWMEELNERILLSGPDGGLLAKSGTTGRAGQYIEADDAAPTARKILGAMTKAKGAVWSADRRRPDTHIISETLMTELEDADGSDGFLLPPWAAWARNVGGAGTLPEREGPTSEMEWRRVGVYVDPAITDTWKDDESAATGGDQTRIITMVSSEMPAFYDGPMTMQYDQTLAGSGRVLIVVRGYAAFQPMWRPQAWRITRGTALKLPLPASSSVDLQAHVDQLQARIADLEARQPASKPARKPASKPASKPAADPDQS